MAEEKIHIEENYRQVLQKINSLGSKKKNHSTKIKLLATSKKQAVDKIIALYRCGHRDFAENFYQEMEEKASSMSQKGFSDISWYFIGRLQSNKIKKIVSLSCEIQSLASLKHAKMVNDYALQLKKAPFKVYLLVNVAREVSKAGFFFEDLDGCVNQIEKNMNGISLEGLMAIPPKIDLKVKPITYYKELYEKLAACSKKVGKGKLSLGMSSDLELAIECGSSCVRVGTAIFGPRESF